MEIYEVWKYKSTKYDKSTKQGGLFAAYIDQFLKIKQKASGYPSSVITEDEKLEFVKQFEEKEGIALDIAEVEPNPGPRALSKLCLNRYVAL